MLRIGADTKLFKPDGSRPRKLGAVTTAHHWGTVRGVHEALMKLPDDIDAVMYGNVTKTAPAALVRRAHKPVPFFSMPAVYRSRPIVIDDLNAVNIGYGNLNSRFFESAACGAVPIVNGLLGLRELGITDVPSFRTPRQLAIAIRELTEDRARFERLAADLGDLVRREHSYVVRARQFVDLVFGTGADDGPARTAPSKALHFGPNYGGDNPYQPMLYSRLTDIDYYPIPVPTRGITDHLEKHAALASPGRFHLHWTTPILQSCVSAFAAAAELERFKRAVAAFKERGGKLLWTIHNVLPHDSKYVSLEIELAQAIVEHADLIHVISEETIEEVAAHYPLPAHKTVVVEHSSYVGQYKQWVSRDAARERLGIAPSEKVVIALGGIKPYKGLGALLDTFERLSEQDPALRLLVAGRPGKYREVQEFRERCEAHPRIVSHFDHLPDDHLQVWLGAADLAVLPYQKILNSGAFWLAQTFGLPLVGPRAGALAAHEYHDHVRLFEPGRPGSFDSVFTRALEDLVVLGDAGQLRRSALDAAGERSPAVMGEEFAKALARL